MTNRDMEVVFLKQELRDLQTQVNTKQGEPTNLPDNVKYKGLIVYFVPKKFKSTNNFIFEAQ